MERLASVERLAREELDCGNDYVARISAATEGRSGILLVAMAGLTLTLLLVCPMSLCCCFLCTSMPLRRIDTFAVHVSDTNGKGFAIPYKNMKWFDAFFVLVAVAALSSAVGTRLVRISHIIVWATVRCKTTQRQQSQTVEKLAKHTPNSFSLPDCVSNLSRTGAEP